MSLSNSCNPKSLTRVYARFQPFQRTIDSLWAKLVPESKEADYRTLAFMSPDKGEGTTMMATCAAIGLARHLRARVLLVEANTSSAGLAHYVGAENSPGLIEALTIEVDIEDALRTTDVAGLSLLPVGERTTSHTRPLLEQTSRVAVQSAQRRVRLRDLRRRSHSN